MKKLEFKRLIAAALCAFFAILLSVRPGAAADASPEDDAEEQTRLDIISNFWKYVNEGDWLSWAELYTPVERPDRLELVQNEQNHRQNIGILTITGANLTEVTKVDSSYAPWIYTELHPYYENEDTFACYRVCVDITVAEENGDFKNGVCYQLFVLVREAGEWGVGAMCSCPDELLPGNESRHDNPYYMIKNRDYSDAYIVLPIDYIEHLGNGAYDRQEPFDMRFALPKGWSYREADEDMNFDYLTAWQNDGGDHSIVLLYNGANVCVGALGYANTDGEYADLKPLFASLENEDTDCLEEKIYIGVGRQLERPSTNITVISCASKLPGSDHPLIISYSEEEHVFIAIEFKTNALSSLQLMDMAEGIRIY